MNKKLLKTLLIPIIISVVFFIVQAFFLIKDFGFFSVIEENRVSFQGAKPLQAPLLKGEKIVGKFKATEDNLGVMLLKFIKLGNGTDTLVLRLKEEGNQAWYYENKYYGELFQENEHYPFGFPSIPNSKNKTYLVEVESTSGKPQNAVALSESKPQSALVYNYPIGEIRDPISLASFVSKKLTYVIRNTNYQVLLGIFMLSSILAVLAKSIIELLFKIKKNPRKFARGIIASVNVKSSAGHPKGKGFELNKVKIYQYLLNTNMKKRIAIGLFIFLFAFTYRYSESLVNRDILFYATLGGQGDYDQFMRAATCALKFCPAILGQNFLIESSVLGIFYEIFGFTGGIKAYVYLMFIASSIVATLPYILLSRKTWLSIGGIIGSLFIATSDFLTQVALNYPPDNGSVFIFSVFFIVYLLTMYYGTIRWLVALGLIGFFDGMFKALFLINDLVAFALFSPVFFYEKVRQTGKSMFQKKNIKILFLSLIPLIVFLIPYLAWEYFVYAKWAAPYFLRLLVETAGSNFRSETLFYNRSSGKAEQDLILQLFYLLISGLVMIKRVVSLSNLQIIFLAPIFFGLLVFSFLKSKSKIKFSPVKLVTIFLISFLTIALLVSIRNDYLGIHQIFPGEYIYANWTLEIYVSIFLFAAIIFLFILNFKYQAFKLALPILPYVIMLIILTKNAPWLRLLAHVIVWSIILFSFLIDRILSNAKENYALKRFWIGPILLALFIFFYTIPKTSSMVGKLYEGINIGRAEVKYLRWVNSELPINAIILAGGKSDLVTLGENIKKTMVYNSLWSTSLLIHPNRIPSVSPQDFTLIDELKNKDNFNKKRYFVLEIDVDLWRGRVQGVGDNVFTTDLKSNTALHAQDFSIKVYKTNQELNKNIYELRPKEAQ